MSKVIFKINGKTVTRKEFQRHRMPKAGIELKPGDRLAGSAFTASQPWKSISCGCHSSEVREMNEAMRNYGVVGAEFDHTGALTATSRQGRAKALEFLGAADKDGGYGDTNKHDLNGIRELYARPYGPHHHG